MLFKDNLGVELIWEASSKQSSWFSGCIAPKKLSNPTNAPADCNDLFVVTDPGGEGEVATSVQELMSEIESLRSDLTTANSKITALETNQTVNIVTGEIVKTNTKVDGKDVYVKRIDFGTIQDVVNKTVTTGLLASSITLINYEAIGIKPDNSWSNHIPHISYDASSLIELDMRIIDGCWAIRLITNHAVIKTYTSYINVYFTYNS